MKILLRKFNDERYVWKDATYDGKFKVGHQDIRITNIVSVSEDNRSELVKCPGCGKIFKKDSPEIAEHKRKAGTTEICFECADCKSEIIQRNSTTFEDNGDGTYHRLADDTVVLQCRRHWLSPRIGSERAKNNCRYRGCTVEGMYPICDTFTKYPGLFDDIITVDKIIESGYKEKRQYGESTYYLLKSNLRINAVANNVGIVDHFTVKYYSSEWEIFYSKKYDILFDWYCDDYDVWCPNIPADAVKRIKNKIASLYN